MVTRRKSILDVFEARCEGEVDLHDVARGNGHDCVAVSIQEARERGEGECKSVDAHVASAFDGGGARSGPERIVVLLDPHNLVLAVDRDAHRHAVGVASICAQLPHKPQLQFTRGVRRGELLHGEA
jgi:hypothetical protein